MNGLVTIVMSYYKRQKLLEKTLFSMLESKYRNFNVIIVDDGSPEDIILPPLPFDVTIIKLSGKTWTNCAPVYNVGFEYALKKNPDVIIIQSPECYHVGDVISYSSNIKDDSYITFGCFRLDKETTDIKYNINKIIEDNSIRLPDGSAGSLGQNGWWNHPVYSPIMLYWCAAIKAQNLIKLNGIDERFSYGYACEDSYFVDQVRNLGLNIEITETPFVVHQWHEQTWITKNNEELLKKNTELWQGLANDNNFRAVHLLTPDLKWNGI
jgi:glycosyltransferase involved in cell wall biosynthesis